MSALKRLFARFRTDELGATAIEYGIMLALVSIFIIGAVSSVGGALSTKFNTVSNKLQ